MKNIGYIVLGLLVLLGIWFFSTYQGIIGADETVAQKWSDVEVQYQARADKSKNLLEIVKGAADYESQTLKDVIEARTKVTELKMDVNDLTEEKLKAFEEAQARLSGAIGRLIVEQYPTLQAVQAFRDFQAQYEGMENRIAVARQDYNTAARTLNTKIRAFPGSIVNSLFGLNVQSKPYFSAKEGTEDAPDISFK